MFHRTFRLRKTQYKICCASKSLHIPLFLLFAFFSCHFYKIYDCRNLIILIACKYKFQRAIKI